MGEALEWVGSSGEQKEKVRLEPSAEVKELPGSTEVPKSPFLDMERRGGPSERRDWGHQGCRSLLEPLGGLGWRHSWGVGSGLQKSLEWLGQWAEFSTVGGGWSRSPIGSEALWVPGSFPLPQGTGLHFSCGPPLRSTHPDSEPVSGREGRYVESSTRCHSPAVTSSL